MLNINQNHTRIRAENKIKKHMIFKIVWWSMWFLCLGCTNSQNLLIKEKRMGIW